MLHLLNLTWSFLNMILRGYLIKTFWMWFIVSQFPSLPTIGILPALGFSFFVSVLTPWKTFTAEELEQSRGKDAKEKLTIGLVNSAIYTIAVLISLGSGWLLHHFM